MWHIDHHTFPGASFSHHCCFPVLPPALKKSHALSMFMSALQVNIKASEYIPNQQIFNLFGSVKGNLSEALKHYIDHWMWHRKICDVSLGGNVTKLRLCLYDKAEVNRSSLPSFSPLSSSARRVNSASWVVVVTRSARTVPRFSLRTASCISVLAPSSSRLCSRRDTVAPCSFWITRNRSGSFYMTYE